MKDFEPGDVKRHDVLCSISFSHLVPDANFLFSKKIDFLLLLQNWWLNCNGFARR